MRSLATAELEQSQLGRFLQSIAARHDASIATYEQLHRWSISHLDDFWRSIWDEADVITHSPPTNVRAGTAMPDVAWFPGATVNYAEHALRHSSDSIAIIAVSEMTSTRLTYGQLAEQVARAAAGLRRLGVEMGDRVAGYLPNGTEAVVTFLATVSIGAIWTQCAPESGTTSALARLRVTGPKVLVSVRTYHFAGRDHDRAAVVAEIRAGLPTLQHTVWVGEGHAAAEANDESSWAQLLATSGPLIFEPVPFGHPLWIVYTSGTTGPPKCLTHSHGGVILEHVKLLRLHLDLTSDDRFFWFSSTGWVMWNIAIGALLIGASTVLYDGSPTYPDGDQLWRLAEQVEATFLGTSAAYVEASKARGATPRTLLPSQRLRAIGVTGSPLSADGWRWIAQEVDDVPVDSICGGTDVCTAFLGPSRLLAAVPGEIQTACLGVDARCLDEKGNDAGQGEGELVIAAPMPSMPVTFWGLDGHARYRETYFDHYPGLWRHGDWVRHTERGGWIVYGRSDATLNRGGVRMGTSEFYEALVPIPQITDAVVIDANITPEKPGVLVLLVELEDSQPLEETLETQIREVLRAELSPRHVPDLIRSVGKLPRTLNGKRLEVPLRRVLLGTPITEALDPGSVDAPDCLAAAESVLAACRIALIDA